MKSNLSYRAWQFWQSLKKYPGSAEMDKVEKLLTPREMELFQRLPVSDQNHSLRVHHTLVSEGETDPDLLKAALLHDIGKTLHPLKRWEKVFAVLLNGLFPKTADQWGKMEPWGLRRPLVVLHQHPDWGASLAEGVGCSTRVVELIRFHEMSEISGRMDKGGLELIKKLQRADNKN